MIQIKIVKLHTWLSPGRDKTHFVLSPVNASTDELPYFQCFFVDEDEAQFPFYAFSPLQIWGLSLSLRFIT